METVLEATELQETGTDTLGCLQGQLEPPKGCSPAWVPQHLQLLPAAQTLPRKNFFEEILVFHSTTQNTFTAARGLRAID